MEFSLQSPIRSVAVTAGADQHLVNTIGRRETEANIALQCLRPGYLSGLEFVYQIISG